MAAIFRALGPLFAILLGRTILKIKPSLLKIVSVLIGVAGVALVVLQANASVDIIGTATALGRILSLALGGVLMNK